MSDKNRVLTNRVFRKKMAALLGTSHVLDHFNDFEALDQTTFAKEMDKLIANPPWDGGESDGPIVYNAIVTTADAQAYTVSEFKDLEDNNITLSAILTALGITIDDGRYVRPVDLKDIVVNVSVNGTGAAAQYANAIGKFHFTVADGISQTVNFSGAVIIAAPGESGFVSRPVLMNLRVSDNDGTPVYTFEQESIE